jgi:hypothetical protein
LLNLSGKADFAGDNINAGTRLVACAERVKEALPTHQMRNSAADGAKGP